MATPVYFYSVDAQLKAGIDRSVSRWTVIDWERFYHIMTVVEDSDTVTDRTLECLRGLAYFLEGCEECGVILSKGEYEKGEVPDTPYMEQAYRTGLSVG